MNPYMNEDVAWQRLKDLQREAENRRLLAQGGSSEAGRWSVRHLLERAWLLAGLAMQRPPRRHPVVASGDEEERATRPAA